jgi:hypothetical protein
MPAKPGTKPPNAGKRGRKPGTPNVVTRTTRELFSAFVDHNAAKAQELFDRVARKNPARALQILSSFSDYVLPRLQRTEMDARLTAGPATVVPAWEDMSPIAASQLYMELMQIGKEDGYLAKGHTRPVNRNITHAPPLHPPEHYEQRRAAVLASPPAAIAAPIPAQEFLPAPGGEPIDVRFSPPRPPQPEVVVPAQPRPTEPTLKPTSAAPPTTDLPAPEISAPEAPGVLSDGLRLEHTHVAKPDSVCSECRAMWVRS